MKVIKSYKNLASPLTLPYLVINSHDVTEHVGLVREHLQATYKPVGKFYKSGQPKCNVLVGAGRAAEVTPLFGIEPATPTTSECTREAEVARIGGGGGVTTVGPALVVIVAEAKGVSGRS